MTRKLPVFLYSSKREGGEEETETMEREEKGQKGKRQGIEEIRREEGKVHENITDP